MLPDRAEQYGGRLHPPRSATVALRRLAAQWALTGARALGLQPSATDLFRLRQVRCSVDADSPDSVTGMLREIMAASERVAAVGGSGETGPDELDLRVVEILAAGSFAVQEAAEKLVRDALRD